MARRRRAAPAPPYVTLSTDIGAAYAAQMKGVLARSLAPGQLVELSHELPRHGIAESAFLLRAMARGFPAGTVHVVVVDPGVGGARAPVVVRCADGSILVGPDNGVLYPLATALGRPTGFRLDPARVAAPPRLGATFDGRDLFAPAAALLAAGTLPEALGDRHRLERYSVPEARRSVGGATGEILHVDHFGNVITNLPTAWVPAAATRLRIRVGRAAVRSVPWRTHYGALAPGRLGALGSSFGTVELAVDRGRADVRLRTRIGTRVAFAWGRRPRRRSIGK